MAKSPSGLMTLLAVGIASAILLPRPANAQEQFPTKPVVKESIAPMNVVERTDGVWFIDFGRDAFANLELNAAEIPGLAPDATIDVCMGEKLADGQTIDRKPGGSIRFLADSIKIDAGVSVYHPALPAKDRRLMPAEIGPVMPFRYAELAHLPAGTTAEQLKKSVRQIAVHYPFNDDAAAFQCADPKLNAIWDLCKYSMKATSFGGIFVDGDRERKPYEGDAYINQLGWYYTTDDVSLPRHSLAYLDTHPTWPTEWSMFDVMVAWHDYLYTGDDSLIRAFYDDLTAKSLVALENDTGLISTVKPRVPANVLASLHLHEKLRDIVDWPAGERDGCAMLPVNTVVNAFHCRSLQLLQKIAVALGKTDDARHFGDLYQRSLASLNSRLFDPANGLYIDGEGSNHSSQHANFFPLAFDLVPSERVPKVAEFAAGRQMACSVYGAQFLLDALFNHDMGSQAIALIEAPGSRSWRHMVEDVGDTITLEAWDNRFKPNQDWNHAWGAAPANLLPRMILGIEPLEPGYAKVLIWPRALGKATAATLPWARGKTPSVKGEITVDWKQSATGVKLSVQLPPGSTGIVRLPGNWGNSIKVDGEPATATSSGTHLEVKLSAAGQHEILLGQ